MYPRALRLRIELVLAFSPPSQLAGYAWGIRVRLQLTDAASLCNPQVTETLPESWDIAPGSSACALVRLPRVSRSQRLWMQLALPSTKRTVRTLVGGKVV